MRALLVASVVAGSAAFAAPDDTVLVSRATGLDGAKAAIGALGSGSTGASISADGRYVAFESDATNLVPRDRSGDFDVFVRDLRTGTTVLASRASGARGAKGDEGSGDAAISGDGRSVAFTSDARNLDRDAPDAFVPVFLRDLRRDRTVLVSRASGARGAAPNASSYKPSVSRDGRFVAFHSEASNLHPVDRDEREDVFVRDLRTHSTVLVSRASGARGAHGNGLSQNASISADGRFVAFESRASNLHPGDRDSARDVYVRDLRLNRTRLVRRPTGAPRGRSLEPTISADGRYVAFVFWAGRNLPRDVYLGDLRAGTTVLVSGAANGSADTPSVSADGRLVAFDSTATNLDPADADSDWDVFVHDVAAGTTRLVSRPSGEAAAAPGVSGSAAIAANGRFVVFESSAPRLVAEDPDEESDVFVRELG
jgi:Tol biopolymer transport system component